MARLPTPGIKVRWFLTILIVVALLGVGFTYYNRLQDEQATLQASIAQSELTIAQLRATDHAELKAEISELEGEVSTAESRARSAESREASLSQRYRGYTHSIEIQERLYRQASEANCTITSLSCSGPTVEESGGIRFESYTVSINATSAVPPSLLSFLLKVSEAYESGVISSVDMSIPRPPEEETADTTSTMSFQLRVVYIPQTPHQEVD